VSFFSGGKETPRRGGFPLWLKNIPISIEKERHSPQNIIGKKKEGGESPLGKKDARWTRKRREAPRQMMAGRA